MAEEVCLGCEKEIDPEEEVLLCPGGQVHFFIECLRKATKIQQLSDDCCIACNGIMDPNAFDIWFLPDGSFIHNTQFCLIKYLVEKGDTDG